jgi:type I restriction enzyme, S subunit
MTSRNGFEHRRLKYVASINNEALTEETAADFELQYVDIGNVDSSGNVHEIATYRFEDAPSRARRIVRDGDVIISTVRTYLQAIAPIQSPPENLIVSTGFAVIRPKQGGLNAGFCKYALREPAFLAEVEMRSVGVSYPAINMMLPKNWTAN